MTNKPLQIVTWWWSNDKAKHKDKGWDYTKEHVEKLYRGFKRHLTIPHEFNVVTDYDVAFDKNIKVIPMWNDLRGYGRCFTRLKVYDKSMKDLIGPRFVSIDLDVVLVNNVDNIFSRKEEFIGYRDSKNPRAYSGCFHIQDAGKNSEVWEKFTYSRWKSISPQFVGSDQAWQSYMLKPKQYPKLGQKDGVYDCWAIEHLPSIPANTKIVFFNGMVRDMSMPYWKRKLPDVIKEWR